MDYLDNEPITKEVNGVQFSIMSPEEIREQSVVEVMKHDTYDKDIPVIKVYLILGWGQQIWVKYVIHVD